MLDEYDEVPGGGGWTSIGDHYRYMLHQKDPPFWRWSRAERPPFLGCSRAERPPFLGTNPNESLLINKGLLFYMQNFIFVMFVKFVFKKPCFSAKTLVPKDPPCPVVLTIYTCHKKFLVASKSQKIKMYTKPCIYDNNSKRLTD